MYRFQIIRYGTALPALPIPRKTEKGAVAFACRHAARCGLHGDLLRVFKKGGRKPVAEITHRVNNYWTYKITGGKREKLVFGKPTGEYL